MPEKEEEAAKMCPLWQVVHPAEVVAFTVPSSIIFDVMIYDDGRLIPCSLLFA